jgi:hypothetical protein
LRFRDVQRFNQQCLYVLYESRRLVIIHSA